MRLLNTLMAGVDVKSALEAVRGKVRLAAEAYATSTGLNVKSCSPRIVAVGKTKPVQLLEEAYICGHRHFGENYVQELAEKAEYFKNKGIDDIKWHFIGRLQRNKSNNLCAVPNLYMVETVDSVKLADALNRSWARNETSKKLRVLVQVNTSAEESKGGCTVTEFQYLVKHVLENCANLEFAGLMAIGIMNHDYRKGPNPDFQTLLQCRDDLCRSTDLLNDQIELSMGMSADFEEAILAGSTNVRIGSTIFGARNTAKTTNSSNTTTNNSNTTTRDESLNTEKSVASVDRTKEGDSHLTALEHLKISE